jgi:hypothetical protein
MGSVATTIVPAPGGLWSQPSRESGDAVAHPHQSATARIGAADPVVTSLDAEHSVFCGCPDRGARGVRVLDDVGECLGHR